MEEPELEEGEACYYKDDASIDPDIALSYIDEKVQNVLGHFQKDFEGGVSAENLGAKFGGYGSFLPTHQRSPSFRSHPKTPQRAQNHNTTRSPNNFHAEVAPSDSMVPSDALSLLSIGTASRPMHSLHNPKAATADVPAKKDSCLLYAKTTENLPLKHEPSLSKLVNPTDQRTLRVRIKVGSDDTVPKNAAIYSGLGLISPSSSTGNSPDKSCGVPLESQGTPDESPASILRSMAYFPVPGGLLLSPLHDSLLCFIKKKNLSLDSKPVPPLKDCQKDSAMLVDDSVSMLEDEKASKIKETVSVGMTETLEKCENGMDFEDHMISYLKKKTETETLDGKQCLSNDFKLKPLSISMCDTGDLLKGAVRAPEAYREAEKEIPVKKREINKDWLKESVLSPDLVKEESLVSMNDCGGGKYEQKDAKSSSIEKIGQHRVRSSHKDVSVDLMEGGRSKGNRVLAPVKANTDVSKCEKDSNTGAMECHNPKVGLKATLHEQDELKMPHSAKKLSFEGKKKSKGNQSSVKLASDLTEQSLRSGVCAAPKDKKSVQEDVQKVRDSYEDVLDVRLEYATNQMNVKERGFGDRTKEYNFEDVKEKEGPNVGPPAEGLSSEMESASVAPLVIEEWVCCDLCQKWRLLPPGTKPEHLPEKWLCSMLNWLPGMNNCDISEDETTKALNALYEHPLLESQNNLAEGSAPGLTSAVVQHFNQKHPNLNCAMPNCGKKKHKARETSNTASRCGLIQTSNFTKNLQQEVMKSKSLNDMNQPLLETNMINKSFVQGLSKSCNFAVERHVDKVKEKHVKGGDTKQKKLKSNRESDQCGYENVKKIKADDALYTDKCWTSEHGRELGRVGLSSGTTLITRAAVEGMQKPNEHSYSKDSKREAKDGLLVSVKKQKDSSRILMDGRPLDMKTSNERGIYLKKRKLKDWQDSQNFLETLRGKGNKLPDGKVFLKQEKSESEIRKEKKSRVSRTGEEESSTSKGHDQSNKKGELTRILLPRSGDNPVDRSVKKDRQLRKHSSNIASQPTLDLGLEQLPMAATSSSSKVSDSRKKVSFQEVKGSPVESVSSSPLRIFNLDKLSPTRRGISGNDDAKNDGFPVLGTPRISLDGEGNFESNRSGIPREGETTVVFHPESLGSPVLNFRDGVANHKFVGKAESRVKPPSDFENTHLVNSDADTLTQHLPCPTDVHVSDRRHNEDTVNSEHCHNTVKFPQKSGNSSSFRPKDKARNSANNFQKVMVKVSDPLDEQESNPKKIRIGRHECAPHCEESIDVKHRPYDESDINSNKDYKSVGKMGSGKRASDSRRGNLVKFREHDGSDAKFGDLCSGDGRVTLPQNLIQDSDGEIAKKRDPTQVESRGGKPQVNPRHAGKQDTLAHARQPVSGSLKGSYSDVGLDVSKVLKQPGKSVHQNGAHNSVGNPGPGPCVVSNLSAPSPVKKDSSSLMANNALKEAEDLRDQADRLKLLQSSGFCFEYNEAYFQAALKFLHGASLLETCNSENSKHGKMAQIQIYCTAAKLYESCAHEYEKRQEMAAAALAYKCMEVAYMRVVYCKSSSTNRDRHDLLASLQMVPQGESPSSSASDVDNLTNQATVDKAALSRGMGSHAGNHVVARNRPDFVRLLDFTNDVNSAMEASRKSQNAFAATNTLQEEPQNTEGIISVKRVIDFSFRDIEKFVRLVQAAREAISRQGFGGNRD